MLPTYKIWVQEFSAADEVIKSFECKNINTKDWETKHVKASVENWHKRDPSKKLLGKQVDRQGLQPKISKGLLERQVIEPLQRGVEQEQQPNRGELGKHKRSALGTLVERTTCYTILVVFGDRKYAL